MSSGLARSRPRTTASATSRLTPHNTPVQEAGETTQATQPGVAGQEQQTSEAAGRPLDSADVLVLRQHYRDIRNVTNRADSFIVRMVSNMDKHDADWAGHRVHDAFRREQLRGFVRNIRVLLDVLDARIGTP